MQNEGANKLQLILCECDEPTPPFRALATVAPRGKVGPAWKMHGKNSLATRRIEGGHTCHHVSAAPLSWQSW